MTKIRHWNGLALVIAAATALTTAALAQSVPDPRMDKAMKAIEAGDDPIPGPRDCFWRYGPIGADPYVNVGYPAAGTFYWLAAMTIPAGAHLTMKGHFPHSRYMSLQSYDGGGRPLDSVADYLIKPAPGSTNPFIAGAERNGTARDFSVQVVDAKPDPNRKTGMNLVGETRDTLAAPHYGNGQQVIEYRVYVPDNGQDEAGGGGLPQPVLTLADGKVLEGEQACQALKTRQPPQLNAAAMAVPMVQYYGLLAAAAKISPYFPAANPTVWYQQLDRQALYDIYTGKPLNPDAPKSEGGFYPNLDNQYIRTILNRKLGKVFVMRAKAPTTPKTIHGDIKMGSGELRYWSFCANNGFANTKVHDCVIDENIPLDPRGYYTIVVSRAEDRPRNAVLQCGVAWLAMPDDGDGAGDADMVVLQLRHMLGTQNFAHSVQAIGKPGNEAKGMGEYFPGGQYTTTTGFEAIVPCLLKKRP